MLTKLTIENFKGIKSCNIDGLTRINLLIGKNDSGKSTIMEAAYTFFRELYASPQMQSILSRRTDVFSGPSQLWFNYDMNHQIQVAIVFDECRFEWKITSVRKPKESYISSRLLGGKVQLVVLGETQYRGTDFTMSMTSGGTMIGNLKESNDLKDALSEYSSGTTFVDCTLKSRTQEVEDILAAFKITPALESRFGKILNDIYGKGEEWQFVPQLENTREKRFAVREGGPFKYFSGFGDGFRYCVGILGNALSMKNSSMFIEEIESHQHFGSLDKLIKHLVGIARENDLQIFLSTHSMEVWESLHRGVYLTDVEKEKNEFSCLLIDRDEQTGKVTVEKTDNVMKINEALK